MHSMIWRGGLVVNVRIEIKLRLMNILVAFVVWDWGGCKLLQFVQPVPEPVYVYKVVNQSEG